MKTDPIEFLQRALIYVVSAVLCLTALAVFVPLYPVMPTAGLDPSWMFALNRASAQHLVFGKDVIFTFGPYASIYTALYDPATDALMVRGSLFLGIAYALLLLLLGKDEKVYGLLAYIIFLASFMRSRDALLFSYPLIVMLIAYRITLPDQHILKLHLKRRAEGCFVLLLAPLGLLPLIKGSFLPLCGVTVVMCCALFWSRGNKILAFSTIGVPAISCLVFWRLSGQAMATLPAFFLNMRQIISGYTEAMAFPGNVWECVLYVGASALILLTIIRTARIPASSKWFLCAAYALFLFIAFKSGFVRHDPWHSMNASTAILGGAILLIFVLGEKSAILPIVMAILVWTYIGQGAAYTGANNISLGAASTFNRALHGARIRLLQNGELKNDYDKHVASISAQFPIPPMSGSTDIYSYNQAWLLASKNTWATRPIVQSYSVYTPELAQLNAQHLESATAPDNILFRVESIDGRLPSLEDGLSWPTLINGYVLQKLDGQTAYLRKRQPENGAGAALENDFYDSPHQLGETVPLPKSSVPLFARIELTSTPFGMILSALFKPPQLHIQMQLRDGSVRTYRAISTMMKTNFLITPLVDNTEEFALLAAAGDKFLTENEVESIAVSSDDSRGLFWNTAYSLKLRKLNSSQKTDIDSSSLFDKMTDAAPKSLAPASLKECAGSIEQIDGSSAHAVSIRASGTLSISGWMAVVAQNGTVPDSIFVTLTSDSGKVIYFATHRTTRNDIKEHFNQPNMQDPGYAALMDVSALNGLYTAGLTRIYKGNLEVCRQFKIPILVSR